MPVLVVSFIILIGGLLAVGMVRRSGNRRTDYDVGLLSEDWLQRQRGTLDRDW